MKTSNPIIEKIAEIKNRAKAIKEANPDISKLWFEIDNCAVEDMRELSNNDRQLDYMKHRKCLTMNFSSDMVYSENGGIVWVSVFVRSVPVQPKEHLVADFAYVNI